MTVDWTVVGNIATAIATLVTALSLVCGYHLYSTGRRDEYVTAFRQTIAEVKAQFQKIAHLISYELSHEVAVSVVNSADMDLALRRVYDQLHSQSPFDEAATKEFLKTKFPPVTVPVRSPIVEKYLGIIDSLSSAIAPYQHTFPAFYRSVSPIIILFRNHVYSHKMAAADDELWEDIITNLFKSESEECKSFEFFRSRLSTVFIGLLERGLNDADRIKDVEDMLRLVDMISDCYSDLDERGIMTQSKKERRIALTPSSQIETATDDLREAEKCIATLLPQQSLLEYRELVSRIEQRNSHSVPV